MLVVVYGGLWTSLITVLYDSKRQAHGEVNIYLESKLQTSISMKSSFATEFLNSERNTSDRFLWSPDEWRWMNNTSGMLLHERQEFFVMLFQKSNQYLFASHHRIYSLLITSFSLFIYIKDIQYLVRWNLVYTCNQLNTAVLSKCRRKCWDLI